MNALDQVAEAVLYEGYILWPYRRSARKNQQRWTFGGIYPPGFVAATGAGDRWCVQTQVLVVGEMPRVDVELRFLQIVDRRVARQSGDGSLVLVDELTAPGGQRILTWEEAIERRVSTGEVHIEADEGSEQVDGGVVFRRWDAISGCVEQLQEPIGPRLWRVTAALSNTSDWRGTDRMLAQRRGFMSAHFVLRAHDGVFISMTDTPRHLAAEVASCRNVGLWPVLVADDRTMLASPIILYDFPRVAPESPGLLFDSSEIDQLLYLNTLALTDEEKAEVRATDARAYQLLERAESLSAVELSRLNGAIRDFQVWAPPPERVMIKGAEIRAGSKVRLHPHGRADAFDMLLAGKLATVESVEEDFDARIHLAVTVDDDPGRDLGLQHMPGHRFFFTPEEVEPIG
jgi:hypothetical protein